MSKIRSEFAVLIVMVLIIGLAASGCGLISKTKEAIDKQKVATVGSESITRGELDNMMVPVIAQITADPQYGANYLTSDAGKTMLLEQKKQMLDSMVEQKLFSQKAKELKLFKDDKEIEDAVAKKMADLVVAYKTKEDLDKKIAESKITPDMLNSILKSQVIGEKVSEYMTKDAAVPDDEMQKYYDANKATFTEKPNTMEVSHILLATEQEANDIKAKLDKGENFEALAKQYSTEPAAKTSGGKLGVILYNDPGYDPLFVAGAMALKEGEISKAVKSSFGYHIIKVTKINQYPILAFDKVKDTIKTTLINQKKQTMYTDTLKLWKDAAKIKIYDNNLNN